MFVKRDMLNDSKRKSIFFAYSWDALSKDFYSSIFPRYKKDWDLYFGADTKTDPELKGEIEKLRNRNKQLFDRFVKSITAADIFIADITSLNPNVMLELGISIKLNKNILIVAGVSKDKIPFDISGVEINHYKTSEQLLKIIDDYLKTYLSVKEMSFSDKIPNSYYFLKDGLIEAAADSFISGRNGADVYRITPIPLDLPRMKDLKIRVDFRILKSHNDSDWFGFIFRAPENTGRYEPVFKGSMLINSRKNGITDLTLYPGETILKSHRTNKTHAGDFQTLEIVLDNEYVKVSGSEGYFIYSKLELVNFGHVYLTCFRSQVEFKNLEILNTDTTTEIL